ncbi:unnamed protein product [Oncorhynchus mykiss]|uniref:Uncharacterized protein n=1 Tax=Oncorhynchus mykiss TaxID=8022 RepID=A0A060YKH8_ONCMY|nr:unnamed protein product [Oncorhynchus mykiss]
MAVGRERRATIPRGRTRSLHRLTETRLWTATQLERISHGVGDSRKWTLHHRHGDHPSSASSDEEVWDLCGCGPPQATASN